MVRLLLLLGIALVITGVPQGAAQSPAVQQLYQKAHADQAAGKDEQAVADYRELLRLDPSIGPAYNNLGRLYYNLGRFPEAVTTLRQGLTIAPDMAPAQVMLGAALFQLGDLDGALAPLQSGVQSLANDRFAHLTLAQVLIGMKRPAEAVPQLDAILAADQNDQQAWYLLGKLHLELSQQAFTQVERIDPKTPLAYELHGEIAESLDNTPGAIDAYKQAIAAAPNDLGAQEHLADVYWKTGDWAHAREQLSTLTTRQPGNCTAHWKLANALDELGEEPEAGMAELKQALDECPALPQAHAERARLLLRLGKPADALPDLAAAERGAPEEPTVQQLYAQAYRALGDRPRAEQANERFQQLQAREHLAKETHAASVIRSNQ